MKAYVYRWSMRPETGLILDLQVTAPSLIVARRETYRFLAAHDGDTWTLNCVIRESMLAPQTPQLPLCARHG